MILDVKVDLQLLGVRLPIRAAENIMACFADEISLKEFEDTDWNHDQPVSAESVDSDSISKDKMVL